MSLDESEKLRDKWQLGVMKNPIGVLFVFIVPNKRLKDRKNCKRKSQLRYQMVKESF
jgi:hypothetical protein